MLAVPESSWEHSERSRGERLLETVAWAPVAPFYEMSIKLEKLSRTTISKHCKLTESTQQIEKLLLLKTCWSFGGAQQETAASCPGAPARAFCQPDWPDLCFSKWGPALKWAIFFQEGQTPFGVRVRVRVCVNLCFCWLKVKDSNGNE